MPPGEIKLLSSITIRFLNSKTIQVNNKFSLLFFLLYKAVLESLSLFLGV